MMLITLAEFSVMLHLLALNPTPGLAGIQMWETDPKQGRKRRRSGPIQAVSVRDIASGVFNKFCKCSLVVGAFGGARRLHQAMSPRLP